MFKNKIPMEQKIREGKEMAEYIIEQKCSIAKAAPAFNISKQTMTQRLHEIEDDYPELYRRLKVVLGGKFGSTNKESFKKQMEDDAKRAKKERTLKAKEAAEKAKAKKRIPKPKPMDKSKYHSISGRRTEWPNAYLVTAKNLLFPGETKTYRIRAKSHQHAKKIWLLIREYQGLTYLSRDVTSTQIAV